MVSTSTGSEEENDHEHSKPTIRICKIQRSSINGSCGFHLTRTKWDPYPWIGGVEKSSPAECAGLKVGDCLLEVNGEDIIGMKVADIAQKVLTNSGSPTMMLLWNAGNDPSCDPESICCGPMPTSLTRLSSCLSSILSVLECPVCLETVPPPAHQCPLGHLICFKCHAYTERCPICRTRFNKGRSLLADKIYDILVESFQLKNQSGQSQSKKLWERLFGKKRAQQSSRTDLSQQNSPDIRNRFLSRLVGKFSSVDNLSSESTLGPPEFPLRKKSLSTNEIFLPSRSKHISHSSLCSSSRSIDTSTTLQTNVQHGFTYRCPCDRNCIHLSTASDIMYHLQESHEGPILQYFQPEFTFQFPLSIVDLSVITMSCYSSIFFVKILQEDSGDIRVHVWLLGSVSDASNFKSIATIFIPENEHNTELTFRTFVYPLEASDTAENVYKDQIVITKGTIDAYFANLMFSLSVSIVSLH